MNTNPDRWEIWIEKFIWPIFMLMLSSVFSLMDNTAGEIIYLLISLATACAIVWKKGITFWWFYLVPALGISMLFIKYLEGSLAAALIALIVTVTILFIVNRYVTVRTQKISFFIATATLGAGIFFVCFFYWDHLTGKVVDKEHVSILLTTFESVPQESGKQFTARLYQELQNRTKAPAIVTTQGCYRFVLYFA